MGCDIHTWVEVQNDQGVWEQSPDALLPCRFCEGTGLDARDIMCGNCKHSPAEHDINGNCLFNASQYLKAAAPCTWYLCKGAGSYVRPYYQGRDYNLFANLANVRGASDIPVFTQEKGIPDDACDVVSAEMDDVDMHTPTWYTVEELKQVNWKKMGFSDFSEAVLALSKLHPDPARVRLLIAFDN